MPISSSANHTTVMRASRLTMASQMIVNPATCGAVTPAPRKIQLSRRGAGREGQFRHRGARGGRAPQPPVVGQQGRQAGHQREVTMAAIPPRVEPPRRRAPRHERQHRRGGQDAQRGEGLKSC